jgi:hypothetical protein
LLGLLHRRLNELAIEVIEFWLALLNLDPLQVEGQAHPLPHLLEFGVADLDGLARALEGLDFLGRQRLARIDAEVGLNQHELIVGHAAFAPDCVGAAGRRGRWRGPRTGSAQARDHIAETLLREKIQQHDQDQQEGQQENDDGQCGVHGVPIWRYALYGMAFWVLGKGWFANFGIAGTQSQPATVPADLKQAAPQPCASLIRRPK